MRVMLSGQLDVRLTAAPVTPGVSTASTSTSSSTTSSASTATTAQSSSSGGASPVTSAQAATIRGVIYAPLVFGASDKDAPEFSYIAPIAIVGFDSIPGNNADVFLQHGYGVRLGHFVGPIRRDAAPITVASLDLVWGRSGSVGPDKRFMAEARFKLPSLPLVIGFDLNRHMGKTRLDDEPDLLQFVFGAVFDIDSAMKKLPGAGS
jgi:hypothetical protein